MRTSTIRPSWRRGLHTGLAGLVLTMGGLALVAPAAGAQTDSGSDSQTEAPRQRPQLTDEQQACLEQQGVTKPADGQRPTDEQREAFEAAAGSCGIDLPAGGPGGGRPRLTDEQQACLEDQGVTKPAEGQEPTDEQRQAFEAAADACGIEPPAHRGPQLTDEQRQCLTDAGVEKPAKGERPTDEQRAAFEAAAEQCGVELPQRPADTSDASDQGSQNQ